VEKAYGFIVCEDGTDVFFHKNDLSGIATEDMPVVFDVREKDGKRLAVHVRRSNEFAEQAYFINRFQGRVTSWRVAGGCGFIGYLDLGQKKSIFFHISDVNAAADGVQYEPSEGCLVDFERGIRRDKEIAKEICIIEWPEVEQPLDEIFQIAEELPVDFPESEPIVESELLKPENRTKTILELIQQRKRV
jgi:cold shock CspA family protein